MNTMSVVDVQEDMKHLPQIDLEVRHHFADGCYARELIIPKGTALVGALHKTNHHFTVSKGCVVVNNGKSRKKLTAPYHGQTYAGEKKLIIALDDSVFTTYHVTNLTGVEEIGKQILGVEL